MKKVMIVFGTRPEAIKMCPLIIELYKCDGMRVIVAVTGQHRQMLDQVLSAFNVVPEYDLDIMTEGQSLFEITEKVLIGTKQIIERERPDVVFVHGDTTTAFAASLAAFYLNVKVAHVEAGLRTYDVKSPFPEEFNRQTVGIISNYNFAPTECAKENLIREGKKKDTIWVTGNTVIDALRVTVKEDYNHPELDWCNGKKMVLITTHRRENLGEPMRRIFRAIKRVIDEHEDVRAIYPMHPNPIVRRICKDVFDRNDRIHLIEPLDVFDFHNFMNAAYIILTDSGGIQEEAPSLGKPVLVLRDTTERPEAVEAGTVKLVGTEEENVYSEFTRLLDNHDEYKRMAEAINPYGDGKASIRIANVMAEIFSGEQD